MSKLPQPPGDPPRDEKLERWARNFAVFLLAVLALLSVSVMVCGGRDGGGGSLRTSGGIAAGVHVVPS